MNFREAFRSGRTLLLDAAMGTELARRGADTRPPLWSARAVTAAPELIKAIHAENVAAGADVLTANTFRLHSRNLEKEPGGFLQERSKEKDNLARQLIAKAIAIAREAATVASSRARRVWIAGSLAPLEDCYRPDLVPDDFALAIEHREMAEALGEAGVDLILVETMNTVRELVAASRAALATGLPVVASMVTDGAGRLLSGEPVEEAARSLLSLPSAPEAIGVNCVPARLAGGDLARLRAALTGMSLSVYANTGRALDEAAGLFTDPISPEAYVRLAAGWLADGGVALIGSCCGTTAEHTAALRARV